MVKVNPRTELLSNNKLDNNKKITGEENNTGSIFDLEKEQGQPPSIEGFGSEEILIKLDEHSESEQTPTLDIEIDGFDPKKIQKNLDEHSESEQTPTLDIDDPDVLDKIRKGIFPTDDNNDTTNKLFPDETPKPKLPDSDDIKRKKDEIKREWVEGERIENLNKRHLEILPMRMDEAGKHRLVKFTYE